MTSSICPHGENSCCMLISPFISHGEISFRTGGLGYTPEMCMWMTTCYASKTRLPQNDDKQTRYPHKYVYALKSESLLIHPKILTRKSESVLIHSLR